MAINLAKLQTRQTLKSVGTRLQFSFHFHTSQLLSGLKTQGHSQPLGLELPCFPHARQLLDGSSSLDILQYNRLLFEYSRGSRNREVVNLFVGIHGSGFFIDGPTLSCVFKACGWLLDVNIGTQMHSLCIKTGFLEDVSVSTSLVDMYMKNGCVEEGSRAFNQMGEEKNVVSWTSLLAGYARSGLNAEAWGLFCRMQVEDVRPNSFTFSSVLGALANEGMDEKGMQVHALVIKNGFEGDTYVCNSLINMYSKSGMVRDASAVFDDTVERNVVTWNSLVSCFATNGLYLEAFQLFHHMRLAGLQLTKMIFAPVIKSCASIKELSFSRQLHCHVLKGGFDYDQNIRTALMVTYSKCGAMDDALNMFSMLHKAQNVVSWTAMISGFLNNDDAEKAVKLFTEMNREGICPNDFTYSTILTAQPVVSASQIHAQAIKNDYNKSPTVGTALLDAYVKLGNIHGASKVFTTIYEKDIVAWSAMIAGYAQIGDTERAVRTFAEMVKEGVKPNEYTFSSVINACAAPTAAVEQGKQLHSWSIKSTFDDALCVSSALVTLYAKRGDIESANEVFKRQKERDLVSWNSIISGYAQHGYGRKALETFEEMRVRNLKVDGVTFIGIISACTHTGLVDEGQRYFNIMVKKYHIEPTMEHYSCMVDLYSRAGMFEKAMDIINGMPFPAGANAWRTLLAASRVHRNLEFGELAAEKLISLQPQDPAAYVLVSNMYAAAGNWQKRAEVRKLMDERKVKKEAGYSWIEVKKKTYSFLAGDVSHPVSVQIYSKLEELSTRLRDAGYQPDTHYVLMDVDEEHKETILS